MGQKADVQERRFAKRFWLIETRLKAMMTWNGELFSRKSEVVQTSLHKFHVLPLALFHYVYIIHPWLPIEALN